MNPEKQTQTPSDHYEESGEHTPKTKTGMGQRALRGEELDVPVDENKVVDRSKQRTPLFEWPKDEEVDELLMPPLYREEEYDDVGNGISDDNEPLNPPQDLRDTAPVEEVPEQPDEELSEDALRERQIKAEQEAHEAEMARRNDAWGIPNYSEYDFPPSPIYGGGSSASVGEPQKRWDAPLPYQDDASQDQDPSNDK